MFSVMAGLAFDPVLALRTAAILCSMATAVLAWNGWTALHHPYRRTELWILLDRQHGLPEERAQEAIGGILRACYLRHAEFSAAVALGLWLLSIPVGLLLPEPAPA